MSYGEHLVQRMFALESIFFLSLVLLIVGALLLVRGWWLAPRTAEALCRRCGYDVRARDRVKPICVECGADLTQRRSIRFGRRRVNTALVFTAAACFLFGLPPIIAAIASRVASVPLRQRVPAFAVIADIGNGDPRTAVAAWEELQRRFDAGQLSVEQVNQIFRDSIDLELSRSAAVETHSTRLLKDIWNTGNVSDAVLREYVSRTIRPTLNVRSAVRIGDPIPFAISYDVPRLVDDPYVKVSEHSVLVSLAQAGQSADFSIDSSDASKTSIWVTEGGSRRRTREMLIGAALEGTQFKAGDTVFRAKLSIDVATPGGRRVSIPGECESSFRIVPRPPKEQTPPAEIEREVNKKRNAMLTALRSGPPRFCVTIPPAYSRTKSPDVPVILYLADGDRRHELARAMMSRTAATSVWINNPTLAQMTALLRDDPMLVVKLDETAAARMLRVEPLEAGELWFLLRINPAKLPDLRKLAVEVEQADQPR